MCRSTYVSLMILIAVLAIHQRDTPRFAGLWLPYPSSLTSRGFGCKFYSFSSITITSALAVGSYVVLSSRLQELGEKWVESGMLLS